MKQYIENTKPMHDKFVEPTKEREDLILKDSKADEFAERITEKVRKDKSIEDISKFFETSGKT